MEDPVGKLLIREGLISPSQLVQAKTHSKQNDGELRDSLISLGFLTSETLNLILNPRPPIPLKIINTGLNEIFLTDLLLKAAYQEAGTFTLNIISKILCLSFSIIDELIELLKKDQLIAIRSATGYGRETQMFELTQRGRKRAEAALNNSLYVGAAPVPLKDYMRMLTLQHIQQIEIDSEWICHSLQHMVVGKQLLNQLGPAFSSGRSIFLYGPPGTGKSSISEALGLALRDQIYIPQAVAISGQVIRLYDPSVHFSVEDEIQKETVLDAKANLQHDPRWKKCRRPVVMVGGEFTLDMLDLRFDTISKFYEAPIQMKAANGVFILDDFGRQKTTPREMLNRWIVPLERGTDFLSLHNGIKFEIPFDQISIFCTNMHPMDLVDEAFLRRIRHKIRMPYSTEEEFKEIFHRVCNTEGIEYDENVINYFIDKYYHKENKGLTGSHARDIIDQIIDFSRFLKRPPALTTASVDAAAANYFVES
ncbi:MAG: ATPase [Nitrosomonadales bacterium]|nr:MAG: ATPase [Nitrosomonadales bacterium]